MNTQEAKALPVGHTFTDHDLPEPHEFVGNITEAFPVARVKCSCGYEGLSIVRDDKVVCVACEGRAEHYKKQLGQTVNEVGKDQIAVDELVNDAVSKHLGPLMAQLQKIQAENDQLRNQQQTKQQPSQSAQQGTWKDGVFTPAEGGK